MTTDRIAQGETPEQARDEAPLDCVCGAKYIQHNSKLWQAEHTDECGFKWTLPASLLGIDGHTRFWNWLIRALRRAATLEAENKMLHDEMDRLHGIVTQSDETIKVELKRRTPEDMAIYFGVKIAELTAQLAEERSRREGLEETIKQFVQGNILSLMPEPLKTALAKKIAEHSIIFPTPKEPTNEQSAG